MTAHASPQPQLTDRSIAPEVLLGAVIDMSDDAIFTCDLRGR
jgi:hypothetical protein